ncbi:sensor kinase HydH [Legionella nautarum]|uniref:histidine kinase n=1 Tax=Legionella nautarum TaxID=45070 RepID=A0A0W0WMT8_9GAMM|nr:HAMP domain-containing sensor histidine kinase [Legionella nautarum]KTD33571.1 sensor kinase HydH [Legionella nautarum]
MNIDNLNKLRISLSRSMMVSFLVIVFFSTMIFYLLNQNYEKNLRRWEKQQIENAIALFQSNLSEKLSILANSTIFVDFLRSGKTTRQSLLPDLRYEFHNVNLSNIAGMILKNQSNQVLFQEGKKTSNHVDLSLCYLNRSLDNMGECNYNWILYFYKKTIIEGLQEINSTIQFCSSCNPTNFLKNKKFGSFILEKSIPLNLAIQAKKDRVNLTYIYSLLILFYLVSITIWNRYRVKQIVNEYIADPIENITAQLASNKRLNLSQNYIQEIQYLIDRLHFWQIQVKKTEDQKHEAAIGRLATQVAHDIRSPLTALDVAIKHIGNLEERERLLIRNAVLRINDIANNLLSQYKQKNLIPEPSSSLKPELIADILLKVISEKRIQQENLAIEYLVSIEDKTYGLFTSVNLSELYRALSNLLQNAIEAIPNKGQISLSLQQVSDALRITIEDTGCGISKAILPKILNEQVSVGKQGSGLGLVRAKNTIEISGGKFTIDSEVNIGTKVTIILPIVESPAWFTPKLKIKPKSIIVVVDDDGSIHEVWKARFSHLKISLIKFQNLNDFITWQQNNDNSRVIYLIDYEFLQTQENGLSVIKNLKIGHRSYLVTSHYENHFIQEQCLNLRTSIIPKPFASYIPIELIDLQEFNNNIVKLI